MLFLQYLSCKTILPQIQSIKRPSMASLLLFSIFQFVLKSSAKCQTAGSRQETRVAAKNPAGRESALTGFVYQIKKMYHVPCRYARPVIRFYNHLRNLYFSISLLRYSNTQLLASISAVVTDALLIFSRVPLKWHSFTVILPFTLQPT